MSESKKLTKRQSAVIEDLFTSELKEHEILEKHHVKRHEYERWLANERFAEQIERRIAHVGRQSRIILARNAANAATTLVNLTAGEKGETTRRACLDIIALHVGPRPAADLGPMPPVPALGGLTPEIAARLLAALAGDRQGHEEDKSPLQPLTARSAAPTG